MHYRHILFAGLTAILPGCVTADHSPALPGCQQMECVGIGENLMVQPGFSITPLEVLEDSRCPVEARCVWAGRVLIALRLDMGHETTMAQLGNDEPIEINGGILTLAEVAPVASTRWGQLAPGDYSFGFRFAPHRR